MSGFFEIAFSYVHKHKYVSVVKYVGNGDQDQVLQILRTPLKNSLTVNDAERFARTKLEEVIDKSNQALSDISHIDKRPLLAILREAFIYYNRQLFQKNKITK